MPLKLASFAKSASGRGIQVIIAGAGGAAHLPGMAAAMTPLPVVSVPIKMLTLNGQDSLLSIVQMPRDIPVATVAIGKATNAGLLPVRMVCATRPDLWRRMEEFKTPCEKWLRIQVKNYSSARQQRILGWNGKQGLYCKCVTVGFCILNND
jgi:phosphoribosylaminoimidazole carboxylase PurE protein